MKNKIYRFVPFVLIFFLFFFPDNAYAANNDSRRLDSVLGEHALTLFGKANANMEGLEKYVGSQLLERFKGRTNDLNDIFNGALSIKDGDGLPQTWDKIVDFVFPTEKPDVKITSTPALKAAIGDIIVNMPDNVNLGGDYKFLGKFSGEYPYSWITVPFSYNYVEGVSSPFIYFKIEQLTPVGLHKDGLKYIEGERVSWGSRTSIALRGETYEGNVLYTHADLSDETEVLVDSLSLTTEYFNYGEEPSINVYYSIQDPKAAVYNKTDIVNNSYLNKDSTTIYNILNGQYGDNTTVTHNFDKGYDDFEDYGLSADQNKVDSGNGILAKLLEFIASIPKIIADLLEALMGLVERIINIFIPTAEQVKGIGDSISEIGENFKGKFSAFIDMGGSFSSAFSSPSSIFDFQITLLGESYPLIPSFLASSMGQIRTFLSGALVLFTFTSIYKRIVGSGDVIKS